MIERFMLTSPDERKPGPHARPVDPWPLKRDNRADVDVVAISQAESGPYGGQFFAGGCRFTSKERPRPASRNETTSLARPRRGRAGALRRRRKHPAPAPGTSCFVFY